MPSTTGNYYFVNPTTGNDNYSGTSMEKPFATVAAAYAACTSNNNDVICLSAYASHPLTAMLTVAKNRVHFVGLDGGNRLVDQRCKIVIDSATTAATNVALLKVTGIGCSFRNIKFINNDTNMYNTTCAWLAGEANLYANCSFHYLVQLGSATSDAIVTEDSGTFLGCEFGTDTVQRTVAHTVMAVDNATTGAVMKDSYFHDCTWKVNSTSSSSFLIKLVSGSADVLFTTVFRNPIFVGTTLQGGAAPATAISMNTANTTGTFIMTNPVTVGCTKVAAAATNTGLYISAGTTTALTGGIGVAPVAA